MGYSSFKESPKALITSDQIGPGQIELEHFAPSLFSEFRQISLHTHSGVKSRQIEMKDLTGAFGKNGFLLYANDGSKRFRVQLNNLGAWVITEV